MNKKFCESCKKEITKENESIQHISFDLDNKYGLKSLGIRVVFEFTRSMEIDVVVDLCQDCQIKQMEIAIESLKNKYREKDTIDYSDDGVPDRCYTSNERQLDSLIDCRTARLATA